jgi:hypothetical protein
MNHTNITTKTVSNDFSIVYYTYAAMNKLNGNIRYYNLLENNFEANQIIDGLWLGSLESSYDKTTLKNKGITHVISVLAGYEPPFPDDFNYLVINALDNQSSNLIEVFDDTSEFIANAFQNNGNVLVHCAYGRSRSATIVCAYLIDAFGMHLDTVLKVLKSKRKIVEPNPNYIEQLNMRYRSKYEELP